MHVPIFPVVLFTVLHFRCDVTLWTLCMYKTCLQALRSRVYGILMVYRNHRQRKEMSLLSEGKERLI